VKTGLFPQARPRRAFHYAWIVAAVTFVTLLLTAAIRATISILIVPFENEFHWTPASISTVISVNLILFGLIGPFAAGLIQRFGPRKIMIVSLRLLGIGVGPHCVWYLVGSLPRTSLVPRQLPVSPVCSERWKELTIMPSWFLETFASSRQYRSYSSATPPSRSRDSDGWRLAAGGLVIPAPVERPSKIKPAPGKFGCTSPRV
jgi:Major Facilitator Superfamily